MGTKIGVVQKFTGIQNLGHNWWWANGIRVEYLPKIQYVAAQSISSRVIVEIRRDTREFHRKVFFFMSMFNDISCGSKDNKIECESNAQLVSTFFKKIWSRIMVISRSWFREKVVFYQWRWSTRWMGQNGRKDDGDTRRKRTPSLPSHESTVQRTAQEQRWWKFVNTLLCRPGHDYNCISHNCLCKPARSLRSSRKSVWRIWILSW